MRFLTTIGDGKLDLLRRNYIDMDLATAPFPNPVHVSIKVNGRLRPPGYIGGKNILFTQW